MSCLIHYVVCFVCDYLVCLVCFPDLAYANYSILGRPYLYLPSCHYLIDSKPSALFSFPTHCEALAQTQVTAVYSVMACKLQFVSLALFLPVVHQPISRLPGSDLAYNMLLWVFHYAGANISKSSAIRVKASGIHRLQAKRFSE